MDWSAISTAAPELKTISNGKAQGDIGLTMLDGKDCIQKTSDAGERPPLGDSSSCAKPWFRLFLS